MVSYIDKLDGHWSAALFQKQQQVAEGGFSRLVSPSLKPMSQRERVYARKHSIFLVRNIDRTRGDRRQGEEGVQEKTEEQATLDKGERERVCLCVLVLFVPL